MKLIDTHSHLYAEEFDADRAQAVGRALEAGVVRMLLPAIDLSCHGRMLEMCRTYPEHCLPMMGLHPTSVNDNPLWREELAQVEEYLAHPPVERFYGVGEIGLDFYWSADFKAEQTEAFRRQIELALQYDLPIAVHTRNAWAETLALIGAYKGCGLRGVFHAFTDTVESYRVLKACGDFVFGIGGVVTFKRSALAEVVCEMDLADLVLETDCPYLSPVPHRGKRNESAYIYYICAKIAELKGVTAEQIALQTTATAIRLFGLERDLLK
ncbi:MAG: TatD family hydrolase [Alistipes sp.]